MKPISSEPISSPCILVCAIDDKTGYCFGCGRTSSEIGTWASFHEDQRRGIMAGLDARLATVKRKPKRETRRKRMARQRGEPSSTLS